LNIAEQAAAWEAVWFDLSFREGGWGGQRYDRSASDPYRANSQGEDLD